MARLDPRATVTAAVTLVVVVVLCGAAVAFGPAIAGTLLGEGSTASFAVMETVFTLVIFAPLILLSVVGGAICRINALRPGRHPLVLGLLGATIGVAGLVMAVVYASVAGTLTEGTASGSTATLLAWGAALILVQTGGEEILFRGWLQPVLERAWGMPVAIGVTALAFAGLHVMGGARSPVTLVNLFLGGIMFGILAAYGRGIAGAVAAHFAWNAVEQLGLGLDPNPGIGNFGALLDLEMTGARAWGGSSEGMNASVAMTITLAAIVVPLALVVRHRWREKAQGPRLTID